MSHKGSEKVNEKELFYGSSSTAPEEIYKSEEGFDMRFSHKGMWGQGNYFAESAQYSCSLCLWGFCPFVTLLQVLW